MKRIPFRNDSVFHNLVDTSRLLIGRANHEPFVAISRFPQNLTDWEQAFEDYFKISETGLTKDDIHFFASKLWQILTSCDDRRLAEYEKICWWDFIEASSRSIEYQDFLANTGKYRLSLEWDVLQTAALWKYPLIVFEQSAFFQGSLLEYKDNQWKSILEIFSEGFCEATGKYI